MRPPEADPDDLDHYKALCRDVADTTVEVLHALRDRIAVTDHAPLPAREELLPALARGYDFVATTFRHTVLLAERLIAGRRTLASPDRRAATKRVIREVEDRIAHAALAPEHVERLTRELHERVESLDFDDELGDRPPADIIRDIVHDLGLGPTYGAAPRHKRRTPAEVSELAARATSAVFRRHGIPENPANDAPERHHRTLAVPNAI